MAGRLKLVKEKEKPGQGFDSYAYGDSTYPQGYEFDMYRVYELEGENRFFKLEGTGDSYGTVSWDVDDMVEVFPQEKTIVVYDFEV